jgi:hypothetical protein
MKKVEYISYGFKKTAGVIQKKAVQKIDGRFKKVRDIME